MITVVQKGHTVHRNATIRGIRFAQSYQIKNIGRKVALLLESVNFATLFMPNKVKDYTKGHIITRNVGTDLCGFISAYNAIKSSI